MQISPIVPLFGLVLIAANVGLSLFLPQALPKAVGLQLYVAGLVTLLVSVIDLINPLGISAGERVFVFCAGSLDCGIAYYMVLRDSRS